MRISDYMESKKIVYFSTFFPPFHIGGDATHVENLARLLNKNGNEVHVVHLLDSYYFKKFSNKTNMPIFEKTMKLFVTQ